MRLSRLRLTTLLLVVTCAAADAPPQRPATTITHFPGVNALAVSPDDKTVVTAGVDGTARLWDAATGKPLRVIQAQGGRIAAVAYALGGRSIVTGGADGVLRLWDAGEGRLTKELRAHTREIRSVAVSADGARLASGSTDKTICLWDAETGALLRQIRPYQYKAGDNPEEGAIESLALSPDGSVIASGHRVFDFTVHVWDANTGNELARLEDENNHVAKVVFSPDGATLATVGSRGRDINLWETATWRLRRRLKFGRQPWEFPGAFSPDGWRLVAGAGTSLSVWDLSTGVRAGALGGGHRGRIVGMSYLSDGRRIASASQDGTAFVWDAGSLSHAGPPAPPAPLEQSQLEQLWADLAVEDAAKSYDAIWALAAAPGQSVPLLAQNVRPEEPVDDRQVSEWLRELDDERFPVRERATRELGRLGDAVEPYLRRAMANRPSVEVAQRLEVLLSSIASPTLDADALRAMRSLEVLERVGTEEARVVLETHSKGAIGSKVKRRAQAALARLSHRPPP